MERFTLNIPTRDTTSLKAMEMVVTPMAIGTMAETRETTPMDIPMEAMVTTMEAMETITEAMEITTEAMEITMEAMDISIEEMDNTTPTRWLLRISRQSPVTSARRLDIMQTAALKISKIMLPSPIHSRSVITRNLGY
jgi:hypothetical protein